MKKILIMIAASSCVLLFLFSCSMFKEDKPADQGIVKDSVLNKKTGLVKDEYVGNMKEDTVETLPPPKTDDKIREIIKLQEKKPPEVAKISEPFYVKWLAGSENEEIEAMFNSDVVPIGTFLQQFSAYLKFNYLVDPQVTGSVTILMSKTKITKKEAWELLEQVLWLCGAYCSPEGNVLHILPFTKMPQERKLMVNHDPQANVEVILLSIKNAVSKDMLEKIKPFITPGATVTDIPHQNSILLVETPANVEKIQALVRLLDQKNKNNWPQTVIQCINVSSSRIKNELASILPVLGFPVSTENIQAEPGSISLISLDRLQVVLATAANEEALTELKKWAAILDRTDVGEQEQIFIYKVVNSRADQLLSAITVVFPVESTVLAVSASGGDSSSSSSSSMGSSTPSKSPSSSASGGSSKLTSSSGGNKAPSTTASSSSSAKGQDDKGPASVFDVPVKVFADGVHNRMVIRTTPRTYAMLRAVLERLDTVAAQVLLQVLVSEVTLTSDTQFGLEFSTKRGDGNAQSLFGTNFAALNKNRAAAEGFKYLLTNKNNPDEKFAYLKALAGTGKVKVLSSPQILVASHSEAKISVGDRVPIVTNQITDTGSVTTNNTTVLNSSIEYVDTGIILTITPHVTEGGLITMELEQIVSDAQKTTSSNIDSPTISERILKTALSIRDGGTVIVGGIIKEKTEETNQSVPFISQINFLSKLFGNTVATSTRTEMVVIITGRVIDEHSNLDEITARYKQALKAISDMEKQDIKDENGK